jgi:CHAT domain-containing protein
MVSNQRENRDNSDLNFTQSIIPRSSLSQSQGANDVADHFGSLRDQPHQGLRIPRRQVTTMRVVALASQVMLEARDVMQNIGEMVVLCGELLSSNLSEAAATLLVTLTCKVVFSKIRMGVPDQPLDQLIKCLRVARVRTPELRETHLALAYCLTIRYDMTNVNDDYKEAASILDEIIASGDSQDNIVARAQKTMTGLAMLRSMTHQTPEYSEETIYHAHAFANSSPEEDPIYPRLNHPLEIAAKQRFRYFGSIEGLEPSSKNPLTFGNGHPELGPILEKTERLGGLLSGIRNNDITNIDEAIKEGRIILASSASSSAPRDLLTPWHHVSFGDILIAAYMRTRKIEYLNESISTHRQVLDGPLPHLLRLVTLNRLSLSLLTRSMSFRCHRPQDVDEGLELVSQCINNGHANLPYRFQSAGVSAFIARLTRHPSVFTAYESALSLMQDIPLFAPTLQLQHATLAKTSDVSHSIPLDYASYQVDLHQLEQAIETLERGRALLWSEMRHLRTSVKQLLEVDPQLGHNFSAINRDLEELTKSIPEAGITVSGRVDLRNGGNDGESMIAGGGNNCELMVPPSNESSMADGRSKDYRAVDQFGHLLLKQRNLLKQRDKIISQIQTLPGFHGFLRSLSFDTLRSAASSGPVIMINHSRWRSDILILLHNTPPSLIPTPDDFFGRASALKDKLLDARNIFGPDSDQYNQALAYILRETYDLVGKPVIERLHQLQVSEQSRIWWCPTSVFCSLPLHAMGPIPSDDGNEERYFLDLYIPSYTPTLSALVLESDNRDPCSPTPALPSLLLVAHFAVPSPDVPPLEMPPLDEPSPDEPFPDEPLSEVCKDVKVIQELKKRLPVQSLISKGATTTSVLDGLRDHQFVHFVCHGTLEARKPFDAGFELYGKERLTLLDIVRSQLPAAEFAFLSACHTAELTAGSSADEVLHLAAAVQYCGFRSVVGTMWAMANDDGPELAKYFYKSMLREQGEPVPYYKRSSRALRDAVRKLRRKRGITLERWVNYVHYGA